MSLNIQPETVRQLLVSLAVSVKLGTELNRTIAVPVDASAIGRAQILAPI